MLCTMKIRDATDDDWPAIWAFMRRIVAEGETFSWDRDIGEQAARAIWYAGPPARTVVAVDDVDRVVGTAVTGPNHGGPAAHVATASFMVDPSRSGHGAGRALGERVLELARADGYRAMQFNAVVETNTRAVGLWRSLGFDVLTTVPEAFHHPVHGYVGLHIMHRLL
ncbi:MAG: GNAT family N-acetyltransferase [Propionibacteriales bacterium]|nr:GNAT family N-acetyltransferase [Propionibacteriales bacterium]